MNKQLLLLKNAVLELITEDHRQVIIEQRKLNNNNSSELVISLRDLMLDIILENNQDYYEEVISYEDYELLNKLYVTTMKQLYEFDVFTM